MAAKDPIVVYADGAAKGNPGPAGAGAILRAGPWVKYISRYLGSTTNNVAELTAVKLALESIKDRSRPVVVYVDSRYVWGLLTQGWKAKKNKELVAELRRLVASFQDITIEHVRGHAGIEGNETADRLASRAAETGESYERTVKLSRG